MPPHPAITRLRSLATAIDTTETDINGHPETDLPNFEVYMLRLQCSLTTEVNSENYILADNGATQTILNEDWASIVDEFEPLDGTVSGSAPGTLGQIVGKGYIDFFGDKLLIYVANINTSVLSIGQTCSPPHFMEWRLRGNQCRIINHRTERAITINKHSNNL